MVFKLVRTDTEDPFKIQLPVGTHLLGRGKFLDCEDKRVSRKHGELQVTNDAISIKALHQNPCFYMKKGMAEVEILKLNSSVNLSHGDKFGLLPNSYWYELLHCTELDVGRTPERNSEENTEPLDQTLSAIETQPVRDSVDTPGDEGQQIDTNEVVNTSQRSESPSLIPAAAVPGSPSLIPTDVSPDRHNNEVPSIIPPAPTNNHSPDQSNPPCETTSDGSSPPKRCHSPVDSKDEVKKIKIEPDIKQEPDAQPGPSGDVGSSSTNAGAPTNMPPSPTKPGRERCIYGANCYRRNPVHKAQFAHPSDADWGAGERGVCPYGRSCRRRDPRHWRQHDHPPGAAPPPPAPAPAYRPAQRGTVKRERQSSESDSGDDTQASLIVTGKRARKTIKRPSHSGSEFDDEDNEDPFGSSDEEDEWVPDSQSQYTQNTDD